MSKNDNNSNQNDRSNELYLDKGCREKNNCQTNSKKRSEGSEVSNNNFAESVDWYSEAHKLRQHNRSLIKKIVQLEQNLKQDREALESQILRTRTGEVKIAQQTEELEADQEQIQHLSREMDEFDRTIQRQNVLIETLSKQLETTQEQIARIERESALLQEEYKQKIQKLVNTEKQVDELTARLHRQQRYTLELKAALDECLEVPSPNNSIQQQLNGGNSSALSTKVSSIEPWSTKGSEFDLSESIATETTPVEVKQISLPNLNNNNNTTQTKYSVPQISSPKPNRDRSATRSRKKAKSKIKVNLPKLPAI